MSSRFDAYEAEFGMAVGESNEYLRNQVLTASPEQLQMMLYDGAIRFARQGAEAIKRGDIEASFDLLTRAQRIVLEMLNGLRPEANSDLCEKMAGLYNFVYRRLVDASVNRDTKAVDDALKILDYQRKTWAMLMDKLTQERGQTITTNSDDQSEIESLSIEG